MLLCVICLEKKTILVLYSYLAEIFQLYVNIARKYLANNGEFVAMANLEQYREETFRHCKADKINIVTMMQGYH